MILNPLRRQWHGQVFQGLPAAGDKYSGRNSIEYHTVGVTTAGFAVHGNYSVGKRRAYLSGERWVKAHS